MGAMECNRNGCTSVMCTIYLEGHGYICYDCYQELRKLLEGKPDMKAGDVEKTITEFMETKKNAGVGYHEAVNPAEYLEKLKVR